MLWQNLKKNYLAYLVILGGIVGTWAAFTLLLNRIEYFKNPNFIPPCSINIWLDCGIVMKSKWASLFGFPNTIIGLITYPTAIFTGLIMLLNQKNHRGLMLVCNFLAGIGMITNFVLLYISAYLISSLCPWCILAGIATSNIFFGILHYNILHNHIKFGKYQDFVQSRIRGGWDFLWVIIYYLFMAFFVWFAFFLRQNEILTNR